MVTLLQVKEYLRNQPKLTLGDTFVLKDETPQEFVKNFILDYNSVFNTYENAIRHTYARRHRSASDIFRITYSYFPKVKLISIYRVLFTLLKDKQISSDICGDIHKRVYFKSGYGGKFWGAATDETGLDFTKMPEFTGLEHGNSDMGLHYFNI